MGIESPACASVVEDAPVLVVANDFASRPRRSKATLQTPETVQASCASWPVFLGHCHRSKTTGHGLPIADSMVTRVGLREQLQDLKCA